MIPLKDLNPRRSFPVVTLLLIVANVAVFIHQITLPPEAAETFVKTYALTPSHIQLALEGHRYTSLQAFLPLFTCMFLHGGFLHIIGNMWFLWIFGDNVEDRFGSLGYLAFLLVCGLAPASRRWFSPGARTFRPSEQAARSPVFLGAYIVFFPRARILTLVPSAHHFLHRAHSGRDLHRLWFLMRLLERCRVAGRAQHRRCRMVGARRRFPARSADCRDHEAHRAQTWFPP